MAPSGRDSVSPTGSLRSLAATYFALLQSWEFAQAMALASQLPWRKLSNALQHLAQAEALYHAGATIEGRSTRAALLRKLELAAAEVETCLANVAPAAAATGTLRGTLLAPREASPRSGSSESESSPSSKRHRRQLSGGSGFSVGAATSETVKSVSSYATSPLPGGSAFHSSLLFGTSNGEARDSASVAKGKSMLGMLMRGVGQWFSELVERIVSCGDGGSGRAGMPQGLEGLLGQHGLLSSPALPRFSPTSSANETEGRSSTDSAPEARVANLLIEFLRLIGLRRQMLPVYAALCGPLSDADLATIQAQVLALQESHDDTPALATELIPFRASTLELSVLQQLIHAQSMIAQARMREAILALALAQSELTTLCSAHRLELRHAALAAAEQATGGALGRGAASAVGNAKGSKASSCSRSSRGGGGGGGWNGSSEAGALEIAIPVLFRCLSLYASALRRKAAVYFYAPLDLWCDCRFFGAYSSSSCSPHAGGPASPGSSQLLSSSDMWRAASGSGGSISTSAPCACPPLGSASLAGSVSIGAGSPADAIAASVALSVANETTIGGAGAGGVGCMCSGATATAGGNSGPGEGAPGLRVRTKRLSESPDAVIVRDIEMFSRRPGVVFVGVVLMTRGLQLVQCGGGVDSASFGSPSRRQDLGNAGDGESLVDDGRPSKFFGTPSGRPNKESIVAVDHSDAGDKCHGGGCGLYACASDEVGWGMGQGSDSERTSRGSGGLAHGGQERAKSNGLDSTISKTMARGWAVLYSSPHKLLPSIAPILVSSSDEVPGAASLGPSSAVQCSASTSSCCGICAQGTTSASETVATEMSVRDDVGAAAVADSISAAQEEPERICPLEAVAGDLQPVFAQIEATIAPLLSLVTNHGTGAGGNGRGDTSSEGASGLSITSGGACGFAGTSHEASPHRCGPQGGSAFGVASGTQGIPSSAVSIATAFGPAAVEVRRLTLIIGGEERILHVVRVDERVLLVAALEKPSNDGPHWRGRGGGRSLVDSLGVGSGNDKWLVPFTPRGGLRGVSAPLAGAWQQSGSQNSRPPSRLPSGRFFGEPSSRLLGEDTPSGHASARVDEAATVAHLKRLADALRPASLLDKALQQAQGRM